MRRWLIFVLILGGVGGVALDRLVLLSDDAADEAPPQRVAMVPVPLEPRQDDQMMGSEITLHWATAAELGEGQLYALRFWKEGEAPQDVGWTATPEFSARELAESGGAGRYYWQVATIQTDLDGNFVGLVDGWSETRTFTRLIDATGGTNSPLNAGTRFEEIEDKFRETDPASLITLDSAEAIAERRAQLIQLIWGRDELDFALQPALVEENIGVPELPDYQIDRLTIEMAFGLQSFVYHVRSPQPNGQLFLYHHGHDRDPVVTRDTEQITALLDAGYDVMILSMPLMNANPRQFRVETNGLGVLDISSHNHFPLLDAELDGSALQYFLEPVLVTLNYVDTQADYERYHMTGISGGGWATLVYAALDERIDNSFPVAGSLPMYLRYDHEMIDYEYNTAELYRIANYLDLSVMASVGDGRQHVQIFNQYDPCCFSGLRPTLFEEAVAERATELGGRYGVVIDASSTRHAISGEAVGVILAGIE